MENNRPTGVIFDELSHREMRLLQQSLEDLLRHPDRLLGVDFLDRRELHPQKTLRDLRVHRQAFKQFVLYRPCPCGSGKKFKFCCAKKEA